MFISFKILLDFLFVWYLIEAAVVAAVLLSFPKDDKKKDVRKSAKKDKDPVNKSEGTAKKKKWSKGKVQEKPNNLVFVWQSSIWQTL